MRRSLPVLLLSMGLFIAANANVKFVSGSFNDILARAGTAKKAVLIDFYTDWCRWCDTLDARTYSDAKVSEFVEKNLVPFKIDAEKGEGIEIAKKYQVKGYPTILLLTSTGEEIDRVVGYEPPDKFLESLDGYLKGVNTVGSLKSGLSKNPNNADVQYQLGQKFAMRDLSTAAGYFKKALELDPKNEHADEASFYVAINEFRTNQNPAPLQAFTENYPNSMYASSAIMTVAGSYLKGNKPADAQKQYEAYFVKHPEDAMGMNNVAWELAGQKVLLDYAAQLSAKAVSLAKTGDDKAMYLDTQAAVEFTRGNSAQAISLEEQALGLLKNAPAKACKDYEAALAKFKAGTTTATGNK